MGHSLLLPFVGDTNPLLLLDATVHNHACNAVLYHGWRDVVRWCAALFEDIDPEADPNERVSALFDEAFDVRPAVYAIVLTCCCAGLLDYL